MGEQRGLTKEQIRYIGSDQRLKELIHKEDLFFGVRSGYFNLYYHGASVGRFDLSKGSGLQIETHQKYLGESGDDYNRLTLEQFLTRYQEILANIEKVQAADKGWREKNAQQALILANNRSSNSRWYCVDMEYAQARESGADPNDGRCDIAAVSRHPDGQGRHPVALIELKAGYRSYKDGLSEEERTAIGAVPPAEYGGSLGSGIVGHLADFSRFEQGGRFEQLKEEVCAILENKRALGFAVPCPALCPQDVAERPEFYFLTLWTEDAPLESCRKSMYHYLGVEGHGKLAACNAKKVLGCTFLKRKNYHFLFAPEEMSARKTVDILEEPDIRPL